MRTMKAFVIVGGMLALLGSACSAEVETGSEESPPAQQETRSDEQEPAEQDDPQAADANVTVSGGPECDDLRQAEVNVTDDGVTIGSGDNQVVVDRDGVTIEGEGGGECRIETSGIDTVTGSQNTELDCDAYGLETSSYEQ